MLRRIAVAAFVISVSGVLAQTPAPAPRSAFKEFEVATIKPVAPDAKAGRYIIMQGVHRFVEKN